AFGGVRRVARARRGARESLWRMLSPGESSTREEDRRDGPPRVNRVAFPRRWPRVGFSRASSTLASLRSDRARRPPRGAGGVARFGSGADSDEHRREHDPPTRGVAPPVEAPPALPPTSSEEAPVARATSTAATRATRESPEAHQVIERVAQPSATAPPSSDGWTFDPRRPSDLLAPATLAQAARQAAEPGARETTREPPTGVSKTG